MELCLVLNKIDRLVLQKKYKALGLDLFPFLVPSVSYFYFLISQRRMSILKMFWSKLMLFMPLLRERNHSK